MKSKTLMLLQKIVSSNDPTIQKFKLYAISYMEKLHFCKLHHFPVIESLSLHHVLIASCPWFGQIQMFGISMLLLFWFNP